MDTTTLQDEQALREQVQDARAQAERLAQNLHAVDAEIQALAPRREQFQLLEQACASLERLEHLGVASLFWGEANAPKGADLVSRARLRVDAFQAQLHGLDARRQAVVTEIGQHEEALYLLYDDLYEAQQQEERRKLEWIVEREISELPSRPQVMAWSRGGEDDKRLRKALSITLLVCLLLMIVIPMVDLPLPDRTQLAEVPPRLAELVRQEQAKRALPPPKEITPPDAEKKPQPEEERPQEQKPTQPTEQPAALAAGPKEPEAKKAGILAFSEKFASLAQDDVAPRLGLDARVGSADDTSVGRTERSMLTTNAPGSSGGINLASLSRSVGGGGGGGGMAGVAVTRATSAIGGIGKPGADRPLSGDGVGLARTDEEIQIVFDRYKSALYRLYNRELRKDPTLRGQMVLKLTIEPDGSVSMCALQSSDMNAPELAAQVVERVRTINFGAKDVAAITILYPIDFLPAA